MDSNANDLWSVVFFTLLIAGVISFLVYHNLPEQRILRKLRRKAHSDYNRARGTIHKRELEGLNQRFSTLTAQAEAEIRKRQIKLENLRNQKAEELDQNLKDYLVKNHLGEIQGIGPKFQKEILQSVYRGDLADLRYAMHRVRGIGENRQFDIDAWVSRVETDFPQLRRKKIPGKDAIVEKYRLQRLQIKNENAGYEKQIEAILKLQEILEEPLVNLMKVTPAHFYQALREPGKHQKMIREYLNGLYPAWEEIPDWYKKLLEHEQ